MQASRVFLLGSYPTQRCFTTSSISSAMRCHIPGSVQNTIKKRNKEMEDMKRKGHSHHHTVDSETQAVRLQITSSENDAAVLTGVPEEHVVNRKVRIFRPAKNAMQSGNVNTKLWKIEFDNRDRWENPTMGWGSNADPLSNISMAMTFRSKEDAIAFVERQGWSSFVDEAKEKKMQPKSYSINFAWNKRTRRAMK